MPIVPARRKEIDTLIQALAMPASREAALARLRVIGVRVVPHLAEDFARLPRAALVAALPLLRSFDSKDARALALRIERLQVEETPAPQIQKAPTPLPRDEASALQILRGLKPPRRSEPLALSRERALLHTELAQAGSRLARGELLRCLEVLNPDRAQLYLGAALLLGDSAFLELVARVAKESDEARAAIRAIAERERLTPRSRAVKALPDPTRSWVIAALASPGVRT